MTERTAGGSHLIDSAIFGHQWSTEHSHSVFSERSRLARWIRILIALASAQAEVGVIPSDSADAIARLTEADLDLTDIAEGTRRTSHSTLGLIHVLQRALPPEAAQHVYFGITVQDVTDTSLALEMQAIGSQLWVDLNKVEGDLLDLAGQHRDTPMSGRTHGQPGSPITFGYKAASWADEVSRQLERVDQMMERCVVGQLGGAVGSLGFFGELALPLRSLFCSELGLPTPAISWLTARDRLAEFAQICAQVTGTLARVANEVYSLQRQELGEVLEASNPNTVGSITMPHKRNPENSEQIVALARLVRSQAGLLTETMLQEHERDARGWKAEWVAFPELCHYTAAAVSMTQSLISGLEVRPHAMLANLEQAGSTSSQRLLRHLTPQLGKHEAQQFLNDAYRTSKDQGTALSSLLAEYFSADQFRDATKLDTGAAPLMVDAVLEAAKHKRAKPGSGPPQRPWM